MVKSKNIIAGLGVVAGLGMALLPLGAFAATEDETDAHYIRANVGEIISIAMESNKTMTGLSDHSRIEITPGATVNSELIHTVTVNSNARGGYKLLIKADRANLELITAYYTGDDATTTEKVEKAGEAKQYNTAVYIPGITTSGGDALTENAGWGYRVGPYTKSGTTYTAPTLSGNYLQVPTVYGDTSVVASTFKDGSTNPYHTETTAYEEKFDFGYGVKAAADQPSGSYEAAVTYKAVANVLGDA